MQRIAVINPMTEFGEDSRKGNLEMMRNLAADAKESGADLIVFPESFPGEWRAPVTWTPKAELEELARSLDCHIVGGYTEPLDDDGVRCHNVLALYGPSGEVGTYRRTSPAHAPWVYQGGKYWDFDWVPGDELPVFSTPMGVIGIAMCSEIYVPEIARALALKGAEIILFPAGLVGPYRALYETWKTLGWARAIENLAITAIATNALEDQGGLAMICSPEEILLCESSEGVFVVDVDVERVRWLRDQQDRRIDGQTPWKTKPGNLRDWRRQEVWDASPELGRGSVKGIPPADVG